MNDLYVTPVGKVDVGEKGMFIRLEERYIPALQALEGFQHINVLWWFSDFDNEEARGVLQTEKPYKTAPETVGIFAARSPVRPNPIGLTTVQVISIDYDKGVIEIPYIDAYDKTPILDIKPYTPSIDRVERPGVPDWCQHWPASLEESGDFDWENEFNF